MLQKKRPIIPTFCCIFNLQPLRSPPGANNVGVLPGVLWGPQEDRPVVVAAHWDAVPNSPGWEIKLFVIGEIILLKFRNSGYNDNGSGVSVMLEAASTLCRAKCMRNRHTIVFAALDQVK